MMMVVTIIGMITAIAVPQVALSARRSRDDALRTNLATVRASIDAFRSDTGLFPASLAGLSATTAPASGLSEAGATVAISSGDWRGPYLRQVPVDPVNGQALVYTVAAPNVGRVTTSASGNDARGMAYTSY